MKRFWIYAGLWGIALLLCLAFSACGGTDDINTSPDGDDVETEEDATDADTDEQPIIDGDGDPDPTDTADTADICENPAVDLAIPDTGGRRAVAIYDDEGSCWPEPAAWAPGLDAIEAAIRAVQGEDIVVLRITRQQLNHPDYDIGWLSMIVFGGGYAYPGYTMGVSKDGKEKLRQFVSAGGVYAGICAGAFAACDRAQWYNSYYDSIYFGYNLDLYPGLCKGPLQGISDFPGWAEGEIAFTGHESYAGIVADEHIDAWYAGGPCFLRLSEETAVLATYAGAELEEYGEAAVIAHPYGEGTVLLWGPHFEITDYPLHDDAPDTIARQVFSAVMRWAALLHQPEE